MALTDALLVTLATPATWPMALAVFLLRGGLLLVTLPIVVLPSPVSLGNILGPMLMTVVLRGVPLELGIVLALVVLAVVAWIVGGGLIAAILEAEAARLVAREGDDVGSRGLEVDIARAASSSRDALRILAVRLIAHVPTLVALIWGATRLVAAAYRELTGPVEVITPIVIRILRGAPEVIVVILLLWMLGEIVGAVAARRIALGGADVPQALRAALAVMVRHPLGVLGGFWLPTAVLAAVVVPSALAAAIAWGAVRAAMGSLADPFGPSLAVLLLVALWTVGLFLIGVTSAWRAAVWSLAERDRWRRPSGSRVTEPG